MGAVSYDEFCGWLAFFKIDNETRSGGAVQQSRSAKPTAKSTAKPTIKYSEVPSSPATFEQDIVRAMKNRGIPIHLKDE